MKKIILTMIVCALVAFGYFYWNSSRRSISALPANTSGSKTSLSESSVQAEKLGAAAKKIETEAQSQPSWMGSSNQTDAQNVEPIISQNQRIEEERIAKMQKALEKAQSLQSKTNVTPADAIQTLREIEEANGSSNLNGVRLDVLRGNLEVAAKMKSLSEEMQVLQAAAAANKPGSVEQMQQKFKEAEALQKQIKTDFYSSPNLVK